MANEICVLGSYVVDLTSRAHHLPVKGETVMGTAFKMGPGGKGANQAVAAKRAGGDVCLITKVGKDVFGDLAMSHFEREGMDTQYIYRSIDKETGTALIMVDENSANCILVVSAACASIRAAEIQAARPMIEGARYLLTQLEVNLDATEQAIRMAHAAGVCVVMNTAPVQALDDALYPLLDIITPNEIEAGLLSGVAIRDFETCQRAAQVFLEKGVKQVLITLGEKGVYGHDGKEDRLYPALPVQALDTTGAGDAFNGGFVSALAEGKDFFDAMAWGSCTAACSVQKYGTAPSMPYRAEIQALYEAHRHLFE